ncbi:hypothetical protein [Actinomadura sp. 3N508]|uniref:hypothetical protein n=1 Tax=Actinomadura sp. 3N508 TaxID=3375153 RepID=UPI0037A95932
MSEETKHSAQAIKRAASFVATEPKTYLNGAKALVEQYTSMSQIAFGVIGMPAMSSYDSARQSQTTNLQDGAKKLDEMIAGMLEVAGRFDAAERASTIDPARKFSVDTSPPKQSTDVPVRVAIESGPAAAGVGLGAAFMVVAGALGAASFLAPTALVAATAWWLVRPDDNEIARAKGTWEKASDYLEKFSLDNSLSILGDEEWSNSSASRHAFNEWVKAFSAEAGQAKGYADSMATTMESIINSLHTMMDTTAAIAFAALAYLIYLTLFVGTPAAPAAEAAKEMLGSVLGVTVAGGIVVTIGYFLWQAFSVLSTAMQDAQGFKKLEIGVGGEQTTFIDLKVDWQGLDIKPPND